MAEAISTARQAGATGALLARMDSAFDNHASVVAGQGELFTAWRYHLGLRMTAHVPGGRTDREIAELADLYTADSEQRDSNEARQGQ